MPENVVERVVVPRNPPAASVLNKEKFNLFAPMARTNSPGLAAYNPDDFVINDQIVSLNPVVLQEIEENKEDFETLVNELNDLFARYDVTLEALNKAITDGLALMDALKLDKSTNASSIYATDENGAQTLLRYAMDALGYGLVQRTSDGDILVRDTPASISAAINRKYLDDKLVEKLDTPSFSGEQLVRYNVMTGTVAGLPFNNAAQAHAVPVRDANGNFKVGTPQADGDVTPKKWVEENAPAQIVASMNTIEGEGEEKKEYVLRLSLVNRKGEAIPDSETSIDLPLEMAFVGAEAVEDENGNEFVEFTLQNGEKLRVGLSEIFKGKVDKITKSGNYAYVTNSNGYLPISASNVAGSIATYGNENSGKEDKGGYVTTSMPLNPYHATPMQYVNNGLARKVDKPNISLAAIQWVFGQEPNGNPNALAAEKGNQTYHLARYLKTDDTAADSDRKGTLAVTTPQKPLHAANKQYVDDKVDPIKEDVELLKDLSAAVLYDIETVESKDNPVTVPSNALPAATIDKIGTGLKSTSYMDNAISSVTSIEDEDSRTTVLEDNTVKISSDFYSSEMVSVEFGLATDEDIPVETPFKWRVSIVSGSYEAEDGASSLLVSDTMNLASLGEWHESETTWSYDMFYFTLFTEGNAFKYNDLVLKFEVLREYSAFECEPVTSVQINGETVYTVPEAIRALKVRVDEGAGFQNAYGLALSDTLYNYLDLENKQYVINCAVGSFPHGGYWTVEHHEIIDVSAYLTDEDGEITVSAGDSIRFCDNDGILVPYDVPNAITYYIKKGV